MLVALTIIRIIEPLSTAHSAVCTDQTGQLLTIICIQSTVYTGL
eukprot:COSAG02_NODE_3961_length_5981_cov_175.988949_2_plen_44_part_00